VQLLTKRWLVEGAGHCRGGASRGSMY
jgi:hypothetical protein